MYSFMSISISRYFIVDIRNIDIDLKFSIPPNTSLGVPQPHHQGVMGVQQQQQQQQQGLSQPLGLPQQGSIYI